MWKPHKPQTLLFYAIHCFLNTRQRHAINDIAANAKINSNPGTCFSSSSSSDAGVGVCDVTGVDVAAGVCTGDTVVEGVSVSFGVDVEVSNFAFHAVIPPSML